MRKTGNLEEIGRMGGSTRDPGEKRKENLQEDTRKCREICDDR
jgi:hypothetical protein